MSSRVWTAAERDLDSVARLIGEFRDFWGKNEPTTQEIRASAARIMEGDQGEYLLATAASDEPCGVAQIRFRWSVWTSAEDCWLEDLFVRAEQGGDGTGRP